MAVNKKQRCKECKFWKVHNIKYEGSCKRYPPSGNEYIITDATDWCGEWKEKEDDNN